jgi:hypothetical protein
LSDWEDWQDWQGSLMEPRGSLDPFVIERQAIERDPWVFKYKKAPWEAFLGDAAVS